MMINCATCGKRRPHQAKGLCSSCYSKARMKFMSEVERLRLADHRKEYNARPEVRCRRRRWNKKYNARSKVKKMRRDYNRRDRQSVRGRFMRNLRERSPAFLAKRRRYFSRPDVMEKHRIRNSVRYASLIPQWAATRLSRKQFVELLEMFRLNVAKPFEISRMQTLARFYGWDDEVRDVLRDKMWEKKTLVEIFKSGRRVEKPDVVMGQREVRTPPLPSN